MTVNPEDPSGYLNSAQILEAGLVRQGTALSEPTYDGWSVRLRVGREAFVSSQKQVTKLRRGAVVTIDPGDFALILTHEEVKLPGHFAGFISVRLSYKVRGLVNISGFHVDPWYQGSLLFAVYNAGPNPVVVREGDELFMIVFSRVAAVEEQTKTTNHNIRDAIPSHYISAIKGPPASLPKLNNRLEKLEQRVRYLLAVGGTIAASLLVAILIFILENPRAP